MPSEITIQKCDCADKNCDVAILKINGRGMCEVSRDGLAAFLVEAHKVLFQLPNPPTINEHEVVAEGRSAPPKGK